jgi:hypothetical protein
MSRPLKYNKPRTTKFSEVQYNTLKISLILKKNKIMKQIISVLSNTHYTQDEKDTEFVLKQSKTF